MKTSSILTRLNCYSVLSGLSTAHCVACPIQPAGLLELLASLRNSARYDDTDDVTSPEPDPHDVIVRSDESGRASLGRFVSASTGHHG